MKPCPNPECGSQRVGCGSRLDLRWRWVAYAFCDACLMTGPAVFLEGAPSEDAALEERFAEARSLWDLLPREVKP